MSLSAQNGRNTALLSVEKWGRLDIAISNDRNYANPYKDVQLDVVCTGPDGKELSFCGFYDGGKIWRFRFMPSVAGSWKYRAVFSDGAQGVNGGFSVVNSNLPGLLIANRTNPLWFSGTEKQLLVRGFHVGDRFFASNWPNEKREAFLDWVTDHKYNFLTIASHYLNRQEKGRGNDWETPKLWPLDAAEYRKMEKILDELAERQIYVYPFAGFFGKSSNYPVDPAEQEQYIRYTLARIGCFWNVVFNVAGPEPNLKDGWLLSGDVRRLGKLIKDNDIYNHLLTVHNAGGDDPYKDSDWTSFGTLQGPKTLDRQVLSNGLLKNHNAAKPLLAQETLWPGNVYHPAYSDDDLRKNAFVIQMSATAFVYGDFNGESSTGFSGTMELSDCLPRRHEIAGAVWDFFQTLPYYNMKPRQDLVSAGYCLAWPNNLYLVYLENGGAVNVNTGKGEYAVTWINARNTGQQTNGGITSDRKDLNAPDNSDWLLKLTRTDAQTTNILKIRGTKFELNDKPFDFTGVSFFNALYNPTFNTSDRSRMEFLKKLNSYGITVIRIWGEWNNKLGFVDACDTCILYRRNGNLKQKYLTRLKELVLAADSLDMVVELALFSSESKGMKLDDKAADKAVATLTREMKPFRNIIFQVWNEYNYRTPDYFRIIKQNDPLRIVTNSPGGGGTLGSDDDNTLLDYLSPHTSRNGDHWEKAGEEIRRLITKFNKPVVDDEPARNGTVKFGGPSDGSHPYEHIIHMQNVREAGGYVIYHHDMFQTGYGTDAISPDGLPDPDFNPYHKMVFDYLKQKKFLTTD